MYICARIHDLKKEEQLKALLRRPKNHNLPAMIRSNPALSSGVSLFTLRSSIPEEGKSSAMRRH